MFKFQHNVLWQFCGKCIRRLEKQIKLRAFRRFNISFFLNSFTRYNPHHLICPLEVYNSMALVCSHTYNHPTTNRRAFPLPCKKTTYPLTVSCLHSPAPELQTATDLCCLYRLVYSRHFEQILLHVVSIVDTSFHIPLGSDKGSNFSTP